MPSVRKSGCSAVSLIILATSLAGCQESSTFTPVAPSALAERISGAIDDSPFVFPQAIPAGRAGVNFGLTIYLGENPSAVYAMDWTSAANHLTMAVHRLGPSGELDAPQPPRDDCAVPAQLFSGGTAIGAALPRPLCPVVLSNSTRDKPKALELKNLTPGEYSLVITNNGPGNETIRAIFLEN